MISPLGLYIHWPYCARICPYCDFNVYRARGVEAEPLVAAMLDDLKAWRERLGPRPLVSLHFGGGTPSLMEPEDITRLIGAADDLFGLEPGAEIGLEANPMEVARFAGIKAAGVERLSIGVQALNDHDLNVLGRDHGREAAIKAVETAQSLFDRVSADFIYARPGQGLRDWQTEWQEALSWGLGHYSCYQLTYEPGTAFTKKAERGAIVPADDDLTADMFTLTQDLGEAHGLEAYEISNHARGTDQRSRHNQLYWTGADWIGIGPGAHSRWGQPLKGGRQGASAVLTPGGYIKGPRQKFEAVSALEDAQERILMGLRLKEGLNREQLRLATGHDVDGEALGRFIAQGLLRERDESVRLTPEGRLYADRLAMELAPDQD